MVEVEKNTSSDCNFLFIISAPSGTGKTTVCRYLLNKYNDLKLSISSTTRKPRGKEVNGKDYFFLSNDDFLEKIRIGGFLEYAKVFDNLYGTSIDFVHKTMSNGFNMLFDIDWQGMRKIKSSERFNTITIFLLPPSLEELERRLIKRGYNNDEINKRINYFIDDIQKANEYDYIIINDNLDKTCQIISNIYESAIIKFQRSKTLSFIENTIQKYQININSDK